MKILVAGASGFVGSRLTPALGDAGHDVVVVSRSAANTSLITALGATPVTADLFDVDGLAAAYEGADAVVNLATSIPIGTAAVLPGAWTTHFRLRTEGVGNVVAAARQAGVRRIVQESVSFLYADHGDEWISEQSHLEINKLTEPAAVGEPATR